MEKEPKTILCYGDSNTYGLMPVPGGRYPRKTRWTTILGEQLGAGYVVVPEGLSGRTTAFDREGAPWKNGLAPLKAIIGSHVPVDIFIVMLGTNDTIPEVGASAEQIAEGMEQVLLAAEEAFAELQEAQPQVILAVPAPIGDAYEQSTDTGVLDMGAYIKSRQIAGLYEQLAQKHGCTFMNLQDAEVSAIDSEHLTERGHEQVAAKMLQAVLSLEEQTTPSPQEEAAADDAAEKQYVITDECIGCGYCLGVCPGICIDNSLVPFAIDPDRCQRCGACLDICPAGAIVID